MKLRCKNTIKLHKTNRVKGSSSVLVIMIMLLLITFGVLAMMSSYSNLKIARKNADWTQGYYKLESAGELDQITFKTLYEGALTQTNNLLNGDSLVEAELSMMPEDVKKEIKSAFQTLLNEDEPNIDSFRSRLFLYNFYVAFVDNPIYKLQATSNFDRTILTTEFEAKWQPEITFISSDNETNRNLFIKISFNGSKRAFGDNGYSVVEWREIPESFDYEESLEFEDPEGN